MNKILLTVNKELINSDTEKVNSTIREFSPFYERFKSLNIGELKTEDLNKFLRSPKEYFLNLFTKGESLNVGELKLDSKKVYELLDKPEEVELLVKDLELKIKEPYILRNCLSQIENIEIVDDKMNVKKDYLQSLEEKHSIYADTEDQVRAYEILNQIAKNFEELMKLQKKPFFGTQDSWFEFLLTKKDNCTISIKPHSIKQF